jgi:hypothetical protein
VSIENFVKMSWTPASACGTFSLETEERRMYASPSNLSADARREIAQALNARLADGLGDGDTVEAA